MSEHQQQLSKPPRVEQPSFSRVRLSGSCPALAAFGLDWHTSDEAEVIEVPDRHRGRYESNADGRRAGLDVREWHVGRRGTEWRLPTGPPKPVPGGRGRVRRGPGVGAFA